MRSGVRAGGWLVTAVLVSSWALSSASDEPGEPRPEPASGAAPSPIHAISGELASEIDRLTARAWRPAAKIAAREPRVPRAVNRAPAPIETPLPEPAPAPLPVPPPAPRLSGVVDSGNGTLTAAISFLGELHFVKKGDLIAGRFRVESVTVDGVDVFDLTLGTNLRLSLHHVARNSHNVCAIRCSPTKNAADLTLGVPFPQAFPQFL